MEETTDNATNEVQHDLIPDNTVTVIVKVHGKVYSRGASLGDIKPEMPDEDLDSTLRAVRGLGITMQRTVATKGADRPAEYPLPASDVEEDLTSAVEAEAVAETKPEA